MPKPENESFSEHNTTCQDEEMDALDTDRLLPTTEDQEANKTDQNQTSEAEELKDNKRKQIASSAIRIFALSTFFLGVSILQVPLYFPLICEGQRLTGFAVGCMMAIKPIMGLIVANYAQRLVIAIGVEETVIYSSILYALSYVGMSFIEDIGGLISGQNLFIGISSLLLAVQGVTFAGLTIGEQCLLLRYSKTHEREQNTLVFRAAFGIGGAVSPLIGGAFYTWGGFFAAYMSMGIMFALVSPIIYWKLTQFKKDWFELFPEQTQTAEEERRSKAVFSMWKLCQYKEFNYAYFTQILLGAIVMGMAAVNNLFMGEIYGFEPNKAALCTIANPPGFIIGGKICMKLYQNRVLPRRTLIMIGFMITSFAIIWVTGDHQFIFNSPQLWMLICCTILVAAGTAFVITLSFPEMCHQVELIQKDLNIDYNDYDMHAYNAGVYCNIQCFAQSIGPIMSNSLYWSIGVNNSTFFYAGVLCSFGLTYYFVCGPGSYQIETKQNKNTNEKPAKDSRDCGDLHKELSRSLEKISLVD